MLFKNFFQLQNFVMANFRSNYVSVCFCWFLSAELERFFGSLIIWFRIFKVSFQVIIPVITFGSVAFVVMPFSANVDIAGVQIKSVRKGPAGSKAINLSLENCQFLLKRASFLCFYLSVCPMKRCCLLQVKVSGQNVLQVTWLPLKLWNCHLDWRTFLCKTLSCKKQSRIIRLLTSSNELLLCNVWGKILCL